MNRTIGTASRRVAKLIDAIRNSPLDEAGLAGAYTPSRRCGYTLQEFPLIRRRKQSEQTLFSTPQEKEKPWRIERSSRWTTELFARSESPNRQMPHSHFVFDPPPIN